MCITNSENNQRKISCATTVANYKQISSIIHLLVYLIKLRSIGGGFTLYHDSHVVQNTQNKYLIHPSLIIRSS